MENKQARIDPDRLVVRPAYGKFGVYEMTGENRARVLYEGSEKDCHDRIEELRERYLESGKGDSFTIYQLKDDESFRRIRFEGLDRLEKENQAVDKDNYDEVYKAVLKQGTTLDDIYFQFNALRPLDFRGHSLSVSDVVVLHRGDEDKAFYVDIIGYAELPDFLLEKTAERVAEAGEDLQALPDGQETPASADEAAFKLGDRYISIRRTDGGYGCSVFDEDCHLLDGRVYDAPDMGIWEVLREITGRLKQPVYDAERDIFSHTKLQGNIRQGDTPERVDFDALMEKIRAVRMAEAGIVKSAQEIVADFRAETDRLFRPEKVDGMRPADIEDAVRGLVQQMIDEYGLDAAVEDVIVSGSRSRGLENNGSDLDVVVSFSGSEQEDDLFNLLHDEKLFFGSVALDINPINTRQTGTLAEYLPGVEKYLSEKRMDIDTRLRESASVSMERHGYETGAEQEASTSGPTVQKLNRETETPQQTAEELAAEIDGFAYGHDPQEYAETVAVREENICRIAASIAAGEIGGVRAYLVSVLEEGDEPEAAAWAGELLKKLDAYKPDIRAVEIAGQEYGRDGGEPDSQRREPESKGVPEQEKAAPAGEVKRTRPRVSMKQKLAEKKAEIAVRGGKAPEVGRGTQPRGTGVED